MDRRRVEGAGLYIHVPFCRRRCRYCAFVSSTNCEAAPAYLETVLREIALRSSPDLRCDTIHFGGGTPSVLPAGPLIRILEGLQANFDVAPDAEVALEANPGTIREVELEALHDAGVNRIVLGAQSFDEEDLRFLGRIHTSREIVEAFETTRNAGFENVGLDLIYGLPERPIAHWHAQLDRVLALKPEHLSCYMLSFEAGTPLEADRIAGRFAPPAERKAEKLFLETLDRLATEGYPFYEVSNFSREGRFPSKHNDRYWTREPYLGFGPGAHSFTPPVRRWNADSLDAYLSADREEHEEGDGREILRPFEEALETLALGLRTSQGVDLDAVFALASSRARKQTQGVIDRLVSSALAHPPDPRLRLTPRGLAVADAIPLLFDFPDS